MQPRVPVDVSDLTAAWFTEVLSAHASGLEVGRVDVVDAHSGTTGRVAVSLTYRDGDARVPERLFVKLAPFDERQRAFIRRVGIGAAEARLYARLGNELPLRIPRVWHADVDDAGNYVCVLEDVVASGCRLPRPRDADIADVACSTVEELAGLHGAYWESDRFTSELTWVPTRAGFGAAQRDAQPKATQAAGSFVVRALELFGAHMPDVFRAVGTIYVDNTAAVLDWWDEGERTLIHGDPHMGNMFVDGSRAGFFDWAMFSRSPGMRDIAYFCCNSIPTDTRRAIERDLLATYRDRLAQDGVVLDPAAVEEQYRLFSVYSWVSAVSTAAMGARWQPERLAHGAMQRTTQALADLDVPELLSRRFDTTPS